MFDSLPDSNRSRVKCLPITLTPRIFPKEDFNFVLNVQNLVNILIHKIANDAAFLKESLKK